MHSMIDRMAAHEARPKPIHRPLVDATIHPERFSEQLHKLTISVLEEERALRLNFLGNPEPADADRYRELGGVLVEMGKDREPMSEASCATRARLIEDFPFKDQAGREALRVSLETGEVVRRMDAQADQRRAEVLTSITGKNGRIDKAALLSVSRTIILDEAERQIGEDSTPRDSRIKAAAIKRFLATDDLNPGMVKSAAMLMDAASEGEGRIGLRALGKIARDTPDLLEVRSPEGLKTSAKREAESR